MKIALLEIKSKRKECINKDFMGGYGWAFNAGTSILAQTINLVKKLGEKLPIMSFGYLAAIFSKHNHEVSLEENCIPKADLVIMSSSMVDYDYELQWAKSIRKKGVKVGFIGPFSTYKSELFLDSCDFIIKGEPEQAVVDICNGLKPEGLIESKPILDLDSLPFPKWDIFPISKYSYFPALKEKPFLPILASRGCPYGCNYCPYVVAYKYRVRPAEKVFAEIKYLINNFNIKGMIFRDPLFGANEEFVVKLCELLLRENIKLKWVCETRLDLLNTKIVDLMHKAGLRVINTGIESCDTDILKKATRKPVSVEHQEAIIRHCDKLGIRVTAFYILGLPDDTWDSINRTICYAKYLNTHVAQFFIHTPFPGTGYFENIKEDIFEDDWQKFDCYTPVLKHKNLSKNELLSLKNKAFVSYYYRPKYLLRFLNRLQKDLFN